jgi:hypothetical protein
LISRQLDETLAQPEIPYIVKELIRSTSRDTIIREVCLRTGFSWVEGEYLLERTERENVVLLRKKKSPLMMILSIVVIAVGAVLAFVSLTGIVFPAYWAWRHGEGIVQTGALLFSFWTLLPQFLLGTGIVIGGVFALRRALRGMRGLDAEDLP